MLSIIVYLIISEIGGFIFLAATKRSLSDIAQLLIWGFIISPILALLILGFPVGLIVWFLHRTLGIYLYFRFYYNRR